MRIPLNLTIYLSHIFTWGIMKTSPVEGRLVHPRDDYRVVSRLRVQKALRPFLIFNNIKKLVSPSAERLVEA